jgi:hypothetical protein
MKDKQSAAETPLVAILDDDALEQITSATMAKGYDPVTATKGAYAQMKNVVRREAYVMAFYDTFLVVRRQQCLFIC